MRPPVPMRHPVLWALAGLSAFSALALGARRFVADARADRTEADLLSVHAPLEAFSEAHLDGLPEPARRYLRHAVALGTPLSPVCRLEMTGTMTPTPGGPSTRLTAVETLAPRRGFVWTARARMNGLPVRVRDHYYGGRGGVAVTALGLLPIPLGGDAADVARSRLVGEAVWCPTALVHPDVTWEAVGTDRARFTIAVDREPVTVTVRVDDDGGLLEVTLDRWGDPDGTVPRPHPYGFGVQAEGTFAGVTVPTRITGGWLYGTDAFEPEAAASFAVRRVSFAGAP